MYRTIKDDAILSDSLLLTHSIAITNAGNTLEDVANHTSLVSHLRHTEKPSVWQTVASAHSKATHKCNRKAYQKIDKIN